MANNNYNKITSFGLLVLAISIVVGVNHLTSKPDEIKLIDEDGDGFYTIAYENKDIDCNDKNNAIYPGATEIEGDGIDQDCDGVDKLPDFDPKQFDVELEDFKEFMSLKNAGKYLKIYDNAITPSNIDNQTIVALSKRIETSGQFEKAYLYIQASILENNSIRKLENGESVYFYIDKGDTGGHLIKSKSLNMKEENVLENVSSYLYKTSQIELTTIPYKEPGTKVFREIDLLEVLNSENGGYDRKHYIGAFVSTNFGTGSLDELGIAYKCKTGYNCSIKELTN